MDIIEKILELTQSETPILDDLNTLVNTIGGRPTGSAAMKKAIHWGLERFSAAGLENVHLEEYRPGINWLPRIETGEMTVLDSKGQPTVQEPIRIATMPFSEATPSDGLSALVYNIGSGSKKKFDIAGRQVQGRWLLVHTPLMRTIDDLVDEYTMKPAIVARAKGSGALGLLWTSSRPDRVLYRHNLTFDGRMGPLPAAVIERETGHRIAALLKNRNRVNVRLIIENEIQNSPINSNVVAEMTGWEKPNEIVLLGAHLDSWDLGKGALDNGCNVALVIDAARQMQRLADEGFRPRRTLRFILYSGEELGLYGSWFDAKNHQDELDHLKAVVIYDLGTGKTTGFTLSGRHDMKTLVKNALAPIQAFGQFTQTLDASIDTDNFDYLLEGIPTLVANQDPRSYLASYHAETDTLDKVNMRELKNNTSIAAILLWNLANNTPAFAPRQNRKEVIKLLKATGLDIVMQQSSLWDEFISGRRGRQT